MASPVAIGPFSDVMDSLNNTTFAFDGIDGGDLLCALALINQVLGPCDHHTDLLNPIPKPLRSPEGFHCQRMWGSINTAINLADTRWGLTSP